MKNTFLILLLSITTNLIMAQKDTLYFDADWLEVAKKSEASFYRPLPLKKVGDLYLIKDYYINGNLQMNGYWSNIKEETLEGKVTWYYENGKISAESQYKDGYRHGSSRHYTSDGFVRAKGEYKNGKFWTGTFLDFFTNAPIAYKKGELVAKLTFYKGSAQLAKKVIFENGDISKILFFDRNNKSLGKIAYRHIDSLKGKWISFYKNNDGEAISIDTYLNYADGKLNGEAIKRDNKGNVRAKGINKEGEHFNGTFYYNHKINSYSNGQLEGKQTVYYADDLINIKSYHHIVNQKKEGESAHFNKKGKEINGVYKNDKPWKGQFTGDCNFFGSRDACKYINTFKNGQLEGKQTLYYTNDLINIKSYHHIVNQKTEGKSAYFYKDGKKRAKGVYKNDNPWNGTFFDNDENELSSYKEGKKHGLFILYGSLGEIIQQREYDNGKVVGLVKSTGFFKDKICECQYKNGMPFKGEVCADFDVKIYKKGRHTKTMFYDRESASNLKSIMQYNEEQIVKETFYHNNKKYKLLYKNDKPFKGVSFDTNDEESITYASGKKNGPFVNLKNQVPSLRISGNYKNELWNGVISFNNHLSHKATTCVYKNGKPVEGIAMEEHYITSYKDGKKHGLETSIKKDTYYGKNYDSISQNYNYSKLNGDIAYFKEGKRIASGVIKDDIPFQGTIFDGQYHKNTYHKGVLQSSVLLFKFDDYKQETKYIEGTESKDGEEILTLNNKNLASGVFKNRTPYDGKFGVFNDVEYPREITFTSYKKGKKYGVMEVLNIKDEKIRHSIVYKNDIPTEETWLLPFKNNDTIEGNYKKGKPFSGFFYKKNKLIEIINQYKNGVKKGYQYFAVAGSDMENLLDSINYVNGKPFKGSELEIIKSKTHHHIYINGKLIKTNIYNWGTIKVPDAEIVYTANGFITNTFKGEQRVIRTHENVIKEKANQLTFSNTDRTEGSIIFYNNKGETGKLKFANDKIETIDLTILKNGSKIKVYKKEPNTITLELHEKEVLIVFNTDDKLPKRGDTNYFIDFLELLLDKDGIAFFYLNNSKKPNTSCTIKNSQPYNGIMISHFKKDNFYYEEFRDGKDYKKIKNLTKKELLKLIENNELNKNK